MTRLLFGFILAAAIGCTGIQPVGPLANHKSGGDAKTDPASPQEPITIPATAPTPPKCIVHPEDVTEDNVETVRKQLLAEFDADLKSMPSVPVTAEVSEYKSGVKQ